MNHLFDQIRDRIPDPAKTVLTSDRGALTYADLVTETGRLADALARAGVRIGDRVLIQVEKSPEALLLTLACVRAGVIFVPLNPGYGEAEVQYFVEDAEPTLIVATPERRDAIAGVAGSVRVETLGTNGDGSLMDIAREASPDFIDAVRGPDDIAAILYTSGTTGRSKGAMLTHENLASNARTLVEAWRFTADDVLIHALPIFHTHGLFTATNTLLMAGGSMIFLSRFDADAVLAAMPRATSLMGVPTFYVRLLKHPGLTREATAHMRLFTSGSAPLLAETHDAWRALTGHAIVERYGMTETNMNTSNPYDGARVAGTVGPPLAGVALRVTEPESGRPLGRGEVGMIEVKGPNVFAGYWRMAEKTAAEFRPDGFFITGDLGQIDDAGYVTIVGRGKDLVITGGLNVYPKEVESEIDRLPGVAESAVIGLPHPDFGEAVTAVVVPAAMPVEMPQGTPAGGAALDEAAVIAALDGRLARFKQPKRVFFVDELPRNAMGKVQKAALRERYKGTYGG